MNAERRNKTPPGVVRAVLITLSLVLSSGCGARVDEAEIDIPEDIYEEEVWDNADASVRVAALRRDIRLEMGRLAELSPGSREHQARRLFRLMSSLGAEWSKLEGGAEQYEQLEQEIDVLLGG